ncbi:hypothetical protein BT69DRAFT_1354064 [Atractiella rhizophila]|nr:hypothetical protein BT69DRAFT_1354064 [Atractiella rhizophila]
MEGGAERDGEGSRSQSRNSLRNRASQEFRRIIELLHWGVEEKEKDLEKGELDEDAEAEDEEREIDQVTEGMKQFYIDQRGSVLDQAHAVLHDLISASITPLGKTTTEPEPAKFLSAFTEDATWRILWPDHSRQEADFQISAADVFHERCFPLVTFDWNIITDISLLKIKNTPKNRTEPLQSTFLAWANPLDPDQSPLVSRGTIKDHIVINDGIPLITHRTFALERVMQPAWMKPVPRPAGRRASLNEQHRSPAVHKFFNAYQKSSLRIRWLRKYKRWVTPLVAFSSLFGAIQNIGVGDIAGIIFAVLGVLSGVLGIVLLLLDHLVEVTDARIRRESTELFKLGGKESMERPRLRDRAKTLTFIN